MGRHWQGCWECVQGCRVCTSTRMESQPYGATPLRSWFIISVSGRSLAALVGQLQQLRALSLRLNCISEPINWIELFGSLECVAICTLQLRGGQLALINQRLSANLLLLLLLQRGVLLALLQIASPSRYGLYSSGCGLLRCAAAAGCGTALFELLGSSRNISSRFSRQGIVPSR